MESAMKRAKYHLFCFFAFFAFVCTGCGGGGGNDTSTPATTATNTLSVTGITPSSGYTDIDTAVQISGTNFQSGATVSVGGTALSSVTVSSSSSLTGTLSYGMSAGSYDVKVTNSDGQSAALSNGFTVNSPPAEWAKETLSFSGTNKPLTSTSTIILPDGVTYRMYFTGPGGIWTTTSTDGKTWTSPTNTGVTDTGATNPDVIRLTDGSYLMLYGIQTAIPTTEILYRATSGDGSAFTKQGVALQTDATEDNFVSVPDLIYINSTTLRMYFVASTTTSRVHTAASTDNGATWTREGQISISGGAIGGQVNDPDIIQLSNGTYRLFFTTPPANQSIGDLRIRSATSTDGRTFTLESGSRLTPSGSVSALMDPDTVLVIGTTDKYRLYYGANLSSNSPDDLRAIVSP